MWVRNKIKSTLLIFNTLLNIYYNDESHVVQPRQYVIRLVRIVQSTRHTANSSQATSWSCDELTGSRCTTV